ncbi:MAG: xanthine dehydrogenase family protein molybdopterin-binding subunit [Candidatus Binatia bacterium]|jgi:CO/xanthine dehydrogenase Mo-binding subunit|nr:xanthine dehydrogenase family protein molybdopterin-binding subunit [Candidatus Binatia bacterium]
MEHEIAGKSVRRLDYAAKVTGKALYLADMKFPGMCHGKILRSSVPHARLRRIDAAKAFEVPGVVAVLTRDDIVKGRGIDPYFGPVFKDQTIVAVDKVRHVGDPVAAVAALDPNAAEEALGYIEVDYEELPVVADVMEAVGKDAPLVHESVRIPPTGFADLVDLRPIEGTNICTHFKLTRGDIEKGFADSDHIFEDTFTLPTTQHVALEAHNCVAWIDPDGRIHVWSTTQNPFVVRTQLSNIFGVPVSKVRVVVPCLGGGYGSKVYPKVEPLTVALSMKAQRPVRIQLSREEVFATVTKHAAVIRMKTGVKKDGTMVARQCEVFLDTGGYAEIGPRVAKKSGYTASGPYNVPNLKIDSMSVYTNKPPAGAFRGFGVSQSAWAHESQMDTIAHALKIDPLELRMKNVYEEESEFVTGEKLRDVGLKTCIEKVAAAVDWNKKPEPLQGAVVRGKGIACLIKATITPSISSAAVKLNEDGSVTIFTGTVEMGQGSDTLLAQITAEEFGVPLEKIQVVTVDTDVVPYDLTTSSSRSTFHMGKAVQLAVEDLRNQLKDIVAQEFGVPAGEIQFSRGKLRFRETELETKDVVFKRFGMPGGTLMGQGHVRTSTMDEQGEKVTSAFWFMGAGAAEVEVDRETGKIKLLKYVNAVDVGKAIHPLGCQQQLTGASIIGIGQAMYEQMVFDNGQLINPNLIDYVIPSLGDMPEVIESIPVEFPHKQGPFGAKGIGETSLIPVAPAIANAVFDAVGVRIRDLPVTSEKIFLGLEAAAKGT